MRTTASGRMLLSVLVALAVTAAHHAAAVGPPKPRGQETHLFEATVRVPDNGAAGDLEEYNYRLLANVLGRSHCVGAWLTDLSRPPPLQSRDRRPCTYFLF
ncbi:hypothetical protein Zm00014a_003641 [Zea mays]|uniref:Uncharacterized protein n=1 Tax=Zea mays TaxID=4577 RepID=A0A3L6GC55_MAIZE|nr:hypothetical protein Zm00014a_003641 [Zea mays]